MGSHACTLYFTILVRFMILNEGQLKWTNSIFTTVYLKLSDVLCSFFKLTNHDHLHWWKYSEKLAAIHHDKTFHDLFFTTTEQWTLSNRMPWILFVSLSHKRYRFKVTFSVKMLGWSNIFHNNIIGPLKVTHVTKRHNHHCTNFWQKTAWPKMRARMFWGFFSDQCPHSLPNKQYW